MIAISNTTAPIDRPNSCQPSARAKPGVQATCQDSPNNRAKAPVAIAAATYCIMVAVSSRD